MAPPQEIIKGEALERYQRYATEDYPELDKDAALEKYIRKEKRQGIFFIDSLGNRCVFGPDVINFRYNTRTGYHPEYKYNKFLQKVVAKNGYTHLFFSPIPLSYIDRPNPMGFRCLTGHCSERLGEGWNLPQDHERHFFNFPAEISLKIFQFVLVSPPLTVIDPNIVNGTSKKFNFAVATRSYKVNATQGHSMKDELPEYAHFHRHDEKGPYVEKRLITRPIIDASCLRTCKQFYKEGSPILYGENIFSFGMANSGIYCTPPRVVDLSGTLHSPAPFKPGPQEWRSKIRNGISHVQYSHPARMIPGWIYYDPFLRFLHTIGPRNAASIKHLNFSGIVKSHTCSARECHCCSHDLIRSMRIYADFMTIFCTSLRKLDIYPELDRVLDNGFIVSEDLSVPNPNNLPIIPTWRPTNVEEGMMKLFQLSISRITSLQKIRIFRSESPIIDGDYRDLEYYPAEFEKSLVEETMIRIK